MEEDTPFGRIAKPFFLGNDDEFRRNRFKLIPKIIEGNMVIKMAVKDTPTLLGNKIKNYYYRVYGFLFLVVIIVQYCFLGRELLRAGCRCRLLKCCSVQLFSEWISRPLIFCLPAYRNVIGLAIGYAKSIVVDMAFCLQGNEEDELPEVIMGCCRCINVDMTLAAKLED